PQPLSKSAEREVLVLTHLHIVQSRQGIGAARLCDHRSRALTEWDSDDACIWPAGVAEVRRPQVNAPRCFPRPRQPDGMRAVNSRSRVGIDQIVWIAAVSASAQESETLRIDGAPRVDQTSLPCVRRLELPPGRKPLVRLEGEALVVLIEVVSVADLVQALRRRGGPVEHGQRPGPTVESVDVRLRRIRAADVLDPDEIALLLHQKRDVDTEVGPELLFDADE